MKKFKLTGSSAFLLGNILFGVTIALSKLILNHMPLGIYMLPKYLISGLILLLFAKYLGHLKKLTVRQYIQIIGLSLLNVVITNWLFYLALERLPATYSMIATLLDPIIIYVLAIIVLKERVHTRALLGAAVSVVGVLLLFFGSHVEHGVVTFSLLGLMLLLGSVLGDGYGTVYSKSVLQKIPILQCVALQLLLGSIFFVPNFVISSVSFSWSHPPIVALVTLLSLCLVITPIAFTAYFWGIKEIDVEDSATQIYIQMVVGILLAVILLNEKLSALYTVSILIIMLGVWLGHAKFQKVWLSFIRPSNPSFFDIIKGALRRLIRPL